MSSFATDYTVYVEILFINDEFLSSNDCTTNSIKIQLIKSLDNSNYVDKPAV